MQRFLKWFIACGFALLAALFLGFASSGGGCGGRLQSGRSISAQSDTFWVSAAFETDTSHLSMGLLKVDVEPTQVVVEGKPIAALDPQAKSVVVTRADGQLTVVADGTTVYDAPIPR